jgi:hypothetical protein
LRAPRAQAHLCPLPIPDVAIHWQLDHGLWLHPAPAVLVLADSHSQCVAPRPCTARTPRFQPRRRHRYSLTQDETLAFNPGTFATEFCWMVYRPGSGEAEPSSLPQD